MAASQELMAQVHTIIRTTIRQYCVNQAVTRGVPRDKVQPGSVIFIQRFGSAINVKGFDVDYAYLSEPFSFLLERLSHRTGGCGLGLMLGMSR